MLINVNIFKQKKERSKRNQLNYCLYSHFIGNIKRSWLSILSYTFNRLYILETLKLRKSTY